MPWGSTSHAHTGTQVAATKRRNGTRESWRGHDSDHDPVSWSNKVNPKHDGQWPRPDHISLHATSASDN